MLCATHQAGPYHYSGERGQGEAPVVPALPPVSYHIISYHIIRTSFVCGVCWMEVWRCYLQTSRRFEFPEIQIWPHKFWHQYFYSVKQVSTLYWYTRKGEKQKERHHAPRTLHRRTRMQVLCLQRCTLSSNVICIMDSTAAAAAAYGCSGVVKIYNTNAAAVVYFLCTACLHLAPGITYIHIHTYIMCAKKNGAEWAAPALRCVPVFSCFFVYVFVQQYTAAAVHVHAVPGSIEPS